MSAAKRAMDMTISTTLLLLLSPMLAIIAVLIRIRLGTPIVFRQERPGLHGRPFTLLKFRTMLDARDGQQNLLPDASRITRLGRFLRSWSIDETLELVNVLRGEMSLVGPRPLLMEYLERYTPKQMRRHEVLPGITGWAQVNGRNALKWEDKFALDVWYVDNRSLLLDLKILGMTVPSVLKHRGISQPGHATMEEFQGSARANQVGGPS